MLWILKRKILPVLYFKLYEIFLKQYPQHALAESVKLSLENINTPLEELVKGFMEKLDADSSAQNQAD